MNKKIILVIFITGSALFFPLAHADVTVPTANNVNVTTTEATPVTVSLSGASNDRGAITFATSSDPLDGVLGAIGGDGSVTYTPNPNFTGNDSFQYVVAEEGTSSPSAIATIIVSAPPTSSTSTNSSSTTPTPTPVPIHLEIDNATTTLFNGDVTVPACTTPNDATSTVNGFCAFSAANLPFDATWSSYGAFVQGIDGVEQDINDYWLWFLNGQVAQVGIDSYQLQPNDQVLWTIGREPLQVSISTTSPEVNSTTTVTVLGFNANNFDFEPVAGAEINGVGLTTDASGTADILATSTSPFTISVSAAGFLPSDSFTITPSAPSGGYGSSQPSGGGSSGVVHTQLNIPNALAYLEAKQNTDGSFDSPILSDWAAIAFAAENPSVAFQTLKNYELTSSPTLYSATDYERHAMALEALGINPYSGTAVNYIAPIVADFDGTEVGDPSLDNGDIFALFPLLHAGYTPNDSMIQKVAAFILSKQSSDGSWDEIPDMTAAGIQALGPLYSLPGVNAALGKAAGYLASTEQSDGNWGNIDSTSWVQTTINAIIQANTPGLGTESVWTSPSGYYPSDAVANAQQSDGAVRSISDLIDTRVWSTSYAIVAASGKSWVTILQSFPKPLTPVSVGGTPLNAPVSTSTTNNPQVASTTQGVATSTTILSTSTQLLLTTTTTTIPTSTTISTTSTPNGSPIHKKKVAHMHSQTSTAQAKASTTIINPVPQPLPQPQTAAIVNAPLVGEIVSHVWGFIVWVFNRI